MAQEITYVARHTLLEPNISRDAVLFYNHIPKCGGLSLTHMLRGCYPHACDVHHSIFDFNAVPMDRQFYHGHGVSGLEHYLPENTPYFYITILRHPWTLAQSLIRFFRWLTPFDPFYMRSEEKILLEFKPNMLIHYLGHGNAALAEENLFSRYVFFGLQEYFAKSIKLLSQSIPALAQQKITVKNVSAQEEWGLSTHCKDLFYERHAQDITLYEKAVKEFLYRIDSSEDMEQKSSPPLPLAAQNKKGSYKESVLALKESIAHDEDLPGMEEPQTRFENWLEILVHCTNGDAALAQLLSWLQKRKNNRASCHYFAYECLKKAESPVLTKHLPLQAQLLFGICNLRDKHNVCRILVQCRLDIIELWLERNFQESHKHFDYSAFEWLCQLRKQAQWQEKAQQLQQKLMQNARPIPRILMEQCDAKEAEQ